MKVRLFRPEDAGAVTRLSAACARTESDYVLNPMWEDEQEFRAEFERHGTKPEEHLLVADGGAGEVLGLSGFLRWGEAPVGGLLCPIVEKAERGKGLGGELLRGALALGSEWGLRLLAAGIGTRNRGGFSLLTALGFRPVRQHFLMRCDQRPAAVPRAVELGLRPARSDDLQAMHGLYSRCGFEPRSRQQMEACFGDGRHAYAVAEPDGRISAFVELETHWPRRCWVAFVGVEPGLRDRGLGSALVAFALGRQLDAGSESGLLILSPANRSAVRAYEKVGFRLYRVLDVLERPL